MQTLGLCVLMFGGWVLPGQIRPDADWLSPGAPATEQGNLEPTRPVNPSAAPSPPRGTSADTPPRGVEESRQPTRMPQAHDRMLGRGGTGTVSRGQATTSGQQYIPVPPTDPAAALLPLPSQPRAAGRTGPYSGAAGWGAPPIPPTMNAYDSMRSPGAGAGTMYRAPQAAQPPVTKPFSGYRAPPSVSPYLNLNRRSSGDSAENYYTLVRPFIDQRNLNQQFGTELHGLENMSRIQSTALQYLNQQSQTYQPNVVPQYMNLQHYYPGFGQ